MQYTVNEVKARKLFWPGIIDDLVRHEVLIIDEIAMEDIAKDLLEIAVISMPDTYFEADERVKKAREVIMSRCPHEDWFVDTWEYGGATCKTCGYRDHNESGRR